MLGVVEGPEDWVFGWGRIRGTWGLGFQEGGYGGFEEGVPVLAAGKGGTCVDDAFVRGRGVSFYV